MKKTCAQCLLLFVMAAGCSGGGSAPEGPPKHELVPAAGHVNPGLMIYDPSGKYFGTVVEQVTYDSEKQECVRLKLPDNPDFLLRRQAIREGHWFTYADDPAY